MPSKRRRPRGGGEASAQAKQPETPAKRRKKQQEGNEPDPDEAAPMEDTQKENLANGKPVKSRKGKRIAGEKRKGDPAVQAPDTVTVAKRVAKPPKEDKKSKVKTTTKSRSSNRPRQGADMVTVEKIVSHPSHPKTPGQILVMGQGDFGQLGLGDSMTERKKPYPVKGELADKEIVQVECGGMHTTALTTNGKVYTWGCNDESSLGYSTDDGEVYEPRQVKALDDVNIVQVSAGDCHTCALAEDGRVYCWGVFRDSNGPFGMVDSLPSVEPQLVYNMTYNPALKIASGDNHVLILTEEGTVYSFGSGEQGQLGRVSEVFCSRGGRHGLRMFFTPQSIRLPRRKMPQFVDVYAGSYNSFAVGKDDKCAYVWGLNNYSQLGVTSASEVEFYPVKVPEDWLWSWGNGSKSATNSDNGLYMSSGMHHTLVSDKGTVYSMGSKNYGRLGLGKVDTEPDRPTEISSVKGIVKVACGGSCSFGVSKKGEVFSWGMGSTLQLGQADDEDCWEPTRITGKNLEGRKVISVSCGGQHTAILVTINEE